MGMLEKEEIQLPCPKCKKQIEVTYFQIYTQRKAQCKSCGTTYKFNSSDTTNLKSAIWNLEKAQEKLSHAIQKTVKGADILLKA